MSLLEDDNGLSSFCYFENLARHDLEEAFGDSNKSKVLFFIVLRMFYNTYNFETRQSTPPEEEEQEYQVQLEDQLETTDAKRRKVVLSAEAARVMALSNLGYGGSADNVQELSLIHI